jgi:hypothetical protein
MAKFYGEVGYGDQVEGQPGVYSDSIVEKLYFGDVVRNSIRIQEGQSVNDDLTVGHSISIVADAYASEHFSAIRYVKWEGTLWKVVHIELQRPRLLLRLGGVYNGPGP